MRKERANEIQRIPEEERETELESMKISGVPNATRYKTAPSGKIQNKMGNPVKLNIKTLWSCLTCVPTKKGGNLWNTKQVNKRWRSSNHCRVGQGFYQPLITKCHEFWVQPIKDNPGNDVNWCHFQPIVRWHQTLSQSSDDTQVRLQRGQMAREPRKNAYLCYTWGYGQQPSGLAYSLEKQRKTWEDLSRQSYPGITLYMIKMARTKGQSCGFNPHPCLQFFYPRLQKRHAQSG